MKVKIFTEGGKTLGYGHIIRMTSLYKTFNSLHFDVEFVVFTNNEPIQNILSSYKYKVFNWHRFYKKINYSDIDIAVIDSYKARYNCLKYIAAKSTLAIYIDDNNRINYPAGIIVNSNIYAETISYNKTKNQKYLLGLKYSLLRNEFYSVKKRTASKNIQSILISFGGTDLRNLTPKTLNTVTELMPDVKKNVVVGGGFANMREIEKEADEFTEIFCNIDALKMKELMYACDLAFTGGGSTLYEVAATQLPSIVTTLADNQKNNVECFNNLNAIFHAGSWDSPDYLIKIKMLLLGADYLARLRICNNSKYLFSLNGAKNIAIYVKNYFIVHGLKIKQAHRKDIKSIYRLSNDSEVRGKSFNFGKIKFASHAHWYNNKLKSSKTVFLAVKIFENFAGQIRYEIEDDTAIISVSFLKKYRKVGFAYNAVKKSIKLLKKKNADIVKIFAFVKESNKVSINFFKKLGFKESGSKNSSRRLLFHL